MTDPTKCYKINYYDIVTNCTFLLNTFSEPVYGVLIEKNFYFVYFGNEAYMIVKNKGSILEHHIEYVDTQSMIDKYKQVKFDWMLERILNEKNMEKI